MDIPESQQAQYEQATQLGGGSGDDAAEIAQYALDHLTETGEHMSYDEARAKLGKKAAKKAKKAAKSAS
jgi:hypothetical protein